VQLRHATTLTSEQYVSERAWLQARLERCPRHPQGGCDFARHSTYRRVKPAGMRVARWYCRQAQQSWSLLPDCLAARLSGDLDEVERAVVAAESEGVEATARALRVVEVELPGARRWLARRRRGVQAALLALVTLLPGRLGTVPELRALRAVLSTDRALVALRGIGAEHLHALASPLGFSAPEARGRKRERAHQHETGPDPPPG
jgi:hypothetical protein